MTVVVAQLVEHRRAIRRLWVWFLLTAGVFFICFIFLSGYVIITALLPKDYKYNYPYAFLGPVVC